jgi:hypothetical protein
MTTGVLTKLAFAVGVAVPGALLQAQRGASNRPIELGIDAALTYESSDNVKQTALTLPVSKFRVGFFMTDAVSLEPSVSLQYSRTTIENPVTGNDRTSSGTSYDLDFSLLYHFATDRTHSQPFIRPFFGIRGFNGEGNSASQALFGGAIGVKAPVATRLAARFEFGVTHFAEDEPEFASSNRIFGSFGLSFFAR